MNKNLKNILILIFIILVYLILGHTFHIYIPCVFHEITGLYCPGCGVTRMLYSLLSGDMYAAFRYNMLLFVCLPIIVFLGINYIYAGFKNKKPLCFKIPNFIWIISIVILLIWMIIRNIFPYFAP